MKRRGQIVILCEDLQHEVFILRFLRRMGWKPSQLRVLRSTAASGSAEQFVRERFPHEIKSNRSRGQYIQQSLIVMIDGDSEGVSAKLRALDRSCRLSGIPVRTKEDRVAIFVPTWRIETWFAYLQGENVDEGKSDYPKLSRERECQAHIDRLLSMCEDGVLRQPIPQSLKSACDEYNSKIER